MVVYEVDVVGWCDGICVVEVEVWFFIWDDDVVVDMDGFVVGDG